MSEPAVHEDTGTRAASAALEAHGRERRYLLPILHEIVDRVGYIPESAIRLLAESMLLSPVEIEGVISFYSYLPLVKKGRSVLRVCKSTACLLKNSDELLAQLEERLKIPCGKTTPDELFSIEEAHCIGWCDHAPAMLINAEPCMDLTPDGLDRLLQQLKPGDSST